MSGSGHPHLPPITVNPRSLGDTFWYSKCPVFGEYLYGRVSASPLVTDLVFGGSMVGGEREYTQGQRGLVQTT